jgi:hypothetical protein
MPFFQYRWNHIEQSGTMPLVVQRPEKVILLSMLFCGMANRRLLSFQFPSCLVVCSLFNRGSDCRCSASGACGAPRRSRRWARCRGRLAAAGGQSAGVRRAGTAAAHGCGLWVPALLSDLLVYLPEDDVRHSELPMLPERWPLVSPLIAADALPPGEVAGALAEAFANCVIGKRGTLPGMPGVGDSDADFDAFARLCPEGRVLGEKLLACKCDAGAGCAGHRELAAARGALRLACRRLRAAARHGDRTRQNDMRTPSFLLQECVRLQLPSLQPQECITVQRPSLLRHDCVRVQWPSLLFQECVSRDALARNAVSTNSRRRRSKCLSAVPRSVPAAVPRSVPSRVRRSVPAALPPTLPGANTSTNCGNTSRHCDRKP